ncbi:MAG: heavy metal translocating P-type ATPase [Zoogloeaceae bacterium]|jgi:Cu+-exporting ATPase|nr:heavy metal translocating P-type ATPase [Zoogloeaceae bacterium]
MTDTLTLPISGMRCAACASRLEKALNELPGIAASVNFATEEARLTLSSGTNAEEAVKAITGTGFSVTAQTLDVPVSGMHCAACASRLEKVLNALPGVAASVDFVQEKARARWTPGLTDAARIVAAIQDAGFSAALPEKKHALEDEKARREALWQKELRLFFIALLLALPLMGQMLFMLDGSHRELPRLFQLLLATPVQFWIGARFYRGAWQSLRHGGANMDVLVALGTSAAWGFSAFVTLADLHHQHVYFEGSAAVITLVLLGKIMESRAKSRAAGALESLIRLQPRYAVIFDDGEMKEVPVETLLPGDIFLVRPGETVPVDGEVLEGASTLDEAMLTGESRPVLKEAGTRVFAATRNHDGMLRCRATGVGEATMLAHIIRMVAEAQGSKAPVERLVDRVASIFVPAVTAIALFAFALHLAFGNDFATALIAAVSVLVIACPCALGLATPTALMVGIGRGSEAGILIRNAEVLERVEKLDTLAFDKTGTLTLGKPEVSEILPLAADMSRERLIILAAALERGSEHPLARAIYALCKDGGEAAIPAAAGFQAHPGLGVEGKAEGLSLRLGAPRWALGSAPGLASGETDTTLTGQSLDGKTLAALAEITPDGARPLGLFTLTDPVRPGVADTLARLKETGIRCLMLTGDNQAVAARLAGELGLEEFRAEILPADKAGAITELKRNGLVGMVGDGVNDAPALAASDVSFAMGAGSDAAIETADIVLMRNAPQSIVDAFTLSRATLGKIRQNLFLAFIYNIIGIPLAASGLLNPMIAGAAMAASSVSVVGNSLLLRRWQPGKS